MSDTPPLSCRQFLSVLRVPHAPCIPSLPYRTPPQCTSLVAYLVGGALCRQTREGGRRRSQRRLAARHEQRAQVQEGCLVQRLGENIGDLLLGGDPVDADHELQV